MIWLGIGFALLMAIMFALIPFLVYKLTMREKYLQPSELDPALEKKLETFNRCILGGVFCLILSGTSYYTGELILPKTGGTDLNPNNDPGIHNFFVLMLLYAAVGQLIYGIGGRIKQKNS